MNSLGLILMLVAIVGTGIEGGSCLLSERRPLSVGFLNLGLCSLIASYAYLLRSGALVMAPEFGMIMIQGTGTRWFLRIAQVAIALLPIPCWHRIAQLHFEADGPEEPGDRHPRWWILVALALVIGAWSASRIVFLNPNDIESLRVSVLDVWWPPLVIWLAFCLANIMLELARNENPTAGFALAAALIAPMARFALVHQELSDSQSRLLWNVAEPICLIATLALAPRSFAGPFFNWSRRATARLVLMVLLVLAVFYLGNNQVKWTIDLLLPLMLVGVVLTRIIMQSRTSAPAAADAGEPVKKPALHMSSERLSGIVFAASVLIIPICLIDLLSVAFLPRNLDLTILTIFWLSFSARLALGVFTTLPTLFRNGALHLPLFGRAWTFARKGIRGSLDSIAAAVKSFSSGTKWAVAFRTVALTLFALLSLVAVGEMLNYGKLVVEPFEWKGSDKDDLRVSDRVSAGVVNALGEMRRELLPVLQVTSHSAKHDVQIQAAILDNGALAGAIAKGSDLRLTSVDIPLPLITSPIQRLVQWAFNIRVVRGSLHKTAEGKHYLTLIESDRGDSWKVYGEIPVTEGSHPTNPAIGAPETIGGRVTAPGNNAASVQNADAPKSGTRDNQKPATTGVVDKQQLGRGQTGASATQSSLDDSPVCEVTASTGGGIGTWSGDPTGDQLDELIDEAAFRIASADPAFIALGLTDNWKAYRYFRTGLQYWNCYQMYQHWSDLESSIAAYQRAVLEDRNFAPALYRLGLAFQAAGEPDIAIQAFKDALSANPGMIQARIAAAQALSSYSYDQSNLPAIANLPQRADRSSEARRLWADIVSQSNDAPNRLNLLPAYLALCLDNYEWTTDYLYGRKYYLTYFYCSRALASYYQLPRSGRNEPDQRRLEGNILMVLGEALFFHDQKEHPVPVSPQSDARLWVCRLDSYVVNDPKSTDYALLGSDLTKHALRYFQQSLTILPDDDNALCDEASARLYLAQSWEEADAATKKLSGSASAHLALAGNFLLRAHQAAQENSIFDTNDFSKLSGEYFDLTIREFESARQFSPSNPEILNNYATTAWAWWLSSRNESLKAPPPTPPEETLHSAEQAARKAVRLYRLRKDVAMEVNARDTLVEVLIALGRNEEAVDLLPPEMIAQAKREIAGADEIVWDSAQAAVCASKAADRQQSESMIAVAEGKFSEIRHDEFRREERPFTDTLGALSISKAKVRCAIPPDQVEVPEARLDFHGPPQASSQPGCSSMVQVDANLNGAAAETGVALRVWGRGAEDSQRTEPMSIELPSPLHVHRVYFAQLVKTKDDGSEDPLSGVVTFDIPDDKSCAHGHLTLDFRTRPQKQQR